jgi:hypothetical protein
MKDWFVNATTGVMIAALPNGIYLLGAPNRGVVAYEATEVEHVVLRTPRPVTPVIRAVRA